MDYLRKYLKATQHWLLSEANFRDPDEQEEALRLADEATRRLIALQKEH